jgi:hypothetical protein
MKRAYYSNSISQFCVASSDEILGALAKGNEFSLDQTQRDAWLTQIEILQPVLQTYQGRVYFEFSVPRMGRRIDAVVLIGPALFVIEFKVGEKNFPRYAIDQVWDYGLDLKNFHESSRDVLIAPILIATNAESPKISLETTVHNDKLLVPIVCGSRGLGDVIRKVIDYAHGPPIVTATWEAGRYRPTPTIVEAAMALYAGHAVSDISRNDASAINLAKTSDTINEIIATAREKLQKAICFVTGVPGAGKTLVGLNVATAHIDDSSELYSVFLSGNGPLVEVIREALARDRVSSALERGTKLRKGLARSEVKMFIQNVHHFRDECLVDTEKPPIEHVVLFDEAQRAWNQQQTMNFMQRKKGIPGFEISEPEFLISCMDRHPDWAVVVCLVGGGQEINTGEAGIGEWIDALNKSFPEWRVYVSSRLTESEYGAGRVLSDLKLRRSVVTRDELHLAVSMRSFRAERVSELMKQLLDLDIDEAQETLRSISANYPIVITRDPVKAKRWLKLHARGSERFGIVVSSQAERLRPHAVHVKSPMEPVHWFLDGKDDVRSSYYLEDVATEFHVQGLELDWTCVIWDADFRYGQGGWGHYSFAGSRWNSIKKPERQTYLKNAYRVLLTRARQGMVIVVPEGDPEDPTRDQRFYDPTFEYLRDIGFAQI